jgi:hypothetical protein
MEMKSMVYRPAIIGRGFLASLIKLSFLIVTIAFIIATVAPCLEARQLTDFEKATQLYNKGKYEQAIPLLKKHIKTKPKPEAFYMLGYSLYKLGRHEEARKYFKESYLVEPEYSPTPELEKKLNRRIKTARPDSKDLKQAVPQGALPPEAQGLDPSQYKVIDKTSRRKMPETTKSTHTFEPAPRNRPGTKKKKKPSTVTAKKVPPKKKVPKPVTREKPVADKPPVAPVVTAPEPAIENKPAPVKAPSPAVGNKPTPVTAPAPAVVNKPSPRPVPRQAPSARPAPGPAGDEMPLPEWLTPLLGGGIIFMALGALLVIFLLFGLPLFIIARKLEVQRPILAFVPIVQNWTLTSAAGLSFIWGLLITIVPLLFIYPVMLVSERLGKGKILGLILVLILGPLGLLILAIIGKAGGAVSAAATDMPDLSGEPDLDLPDMDDMGFDMEDDAFATDEGFGSEEGVGEHTDDFGTADSETGGSDDFDMDLEPSEDDFNTDDMNLGAMGEDESSGEDDTDGFGLDFDDKSF